MFTSLNLTRNAYLLIFISILFIIKFVIKIRFFIVEACWDKRSRYSVYAGKMPLFFYFVNAVRVSKHVRPPLTVGTDDVAMTDRHGHYDKWPRADQSQSFRAANTIAVKTSRGMRFKSL